MGRRMARDWLLLATCVLVAACGGSGGVEPDPAVAPFVGTWDATVYEIWPESDPDNVIDVLTGLGPFHISVEPSGQYTAVLEAGLGAQVQIGQLSVIGSTIRQDVTTPPGEPPATATFQFTAADYLILDGSIQVDFNDDDTRDPGGQHLELQRR